MQLQIANGGMGGVLSNSGQTLAHVFFDYNSVIQSVVLVSRDKRQNDTILRLLLSYLLLHGVDDRWFEKRNWKPGKLHFKQVNYENPRSEETTIQIASEVCTLTSEVVESEFRRVAKFVHADFKSVRGMLLSVRSSLKNKGLPVTIGFSDNDPFCGQSRITVTSENTTRLFVLWERISQEFDIVPTYHPGFYGEEAYSYVNGATNYLFNRGIEGLANFIHNIGFGAKAHGVPEAREVTPFCVKSEMLTLVIELFAAYTTAGKNKLVEVILAAAGMNSYLDASGHIYPPLMYPTDALRWAKTNPPRRYDDGKPHVRGSEAHMVWAYRTLEAESCLSGARIPQWFLDENWLEIYENAEVAKQKAEKH